MDPTAPTSIPTGRADGPLAALIDWIRSWPETVQDGVVATIVFAVQAIVLRATSRVDIPDGLGLRPVDGWAYVIIALSAIPLLVRRRSPFVTVFMSLAALLAFAALDYAASFTGYALVAAVYSVVVYRGLGPGVAAAAVTFAGVVAAYQITEVPTTGAELFVDALVIGTGVAIGDSTRNRIAVEQVQRSRIIDLAEQQETRAEQAVAEERNRIARELHDLVAHSMSVIAVQAGVGHHLIDQDRDKAKDALATIERTSRQGLIEMRRMLGVLRTGADDESDRAPQPGLGRMEHLVADAEAAGIAVEVSVVGEERPLPPGVDLSAFRIVQEALTNVRKHAGQANVTISICFRDDHVDVVIDDDGRGVAPESGSGGFGQIGMRERAAVVGGTLRAGPRRGGGYRVSARLPYGGPS